MPNNPNNNTFLTATEILTVSAGTPKINKGELNIAPTSTNAAADTVDYYKFTTTSTSNVNINLTGLTGNAKLRFGKLNSAGVFVDEVPASDNGGRLSESIIKTNLTFNPNASNTYYIEVTLSGSAPEANYTLSTFASADISYSSVFWQNTAQQLAATWQMQGKDFSDGKLLPEQLGPDGKPVAGPNGRPIVGGIPSSFYVAGIADLNGDLADDVIWRNQEDGSVYTWMMDGKDILRKADGSYDADFIRIENAVLAIPGNWILAGVADMDGDKKFDMLWRNVADGTTGVWRMDGTKIASIQLIDPASRVGGDWEVAGLGDTNGDEKADLLWRQKTTGIVAIWLVDASRANGLADVPVNQKITAPIDLSYKIIDFKDFTGDGKSDIVWRNLSSGKLAFWELDGADFARTQNGGLTASSRELATPIGLDYFIAGVGDFDGDKKADLLWRNNQDGHVSLWLTELTSSSGFKLQKEFGFIDANGREVKLTPASKYTIEAVRDFNGDGKADIFWRNASEGEAGPWTIKSFPTQSSPGTILLDLNQSGVISIGADPQYVIKGILNTKFTRKAQTLTTGDVKTAFNLGVMDGSGKYSESVSTGFQDIYKFKLERTSIVSAQLLNPSNTSQPQNGATRRLLKEGPDGVFTAITFTDGDRLLSGVYQIEVSSAGGTAVVPYDLSVTGTPIAIDLVGKVFTPPAAVDLANVPDPNAANKPKSQIDVIYTIENKEPSDAGNVKVRFYISRDEIIDPTADKLLKVVGTTLSDELIVPNVPGNSNPNGAGGTVKLELPDGTDLFWLNDRPYYIGMVIDPVSPTQPTGEIEEVGERDVNNQPTGAPSNNYNQALGKDKQVINVTNTQVPNLQLLNLAPSSTTLTRTSTASFTYRVRNDGKRSTAGIVTGVELGLYISDRADLTFENLVTEGARVFLDDISNSSGQAIPVPALTTLAPDGTGTLDLNQVNPNFWAARQGVTQFYLYAFVDPNKNVGESLEDDNVLKLVSPLTITA